MYLERIYFSLSANFQFWVYFSSFPEDFPQGSSFSTCAIITSSKSLKKWSLSSTTLIPFSSPRTCLKTFSNERYHIAVSCLPWMVMSKCSLTCHGNQNIILPHWFKSVSGVIHTEKYHSLGVLIKVLPMCRFSIVLYIVGIQPAPENDIIPISIFVCQDYHQKFLHLEQ